MAPTEGAVSRHNFKKRRGIKGVVRPAVFSVCTRTSYAGLLIVGYEIILDRPITIDPIPRALALGVVHNDITEKNSKCPGIRS